jgi:hypothetical protein
VVRGGREDLHGKGRSSLILVEEMTEMILVTNTTLAALWFKVYMSRDVIF